MTEPSIAGTQYLSLGRRGRLGLLGRGRRLHGVGLGRLLLLLRDKIPIQREGSHGDPRTLELLCSARDVM
jgi:hypothetical protein